MQMNGKNSNYNPNDQVSLEGLAAAQEPAFHAGDKVTVLVDHVMGGMVMKMKGAPATIVAGYHTRVYAVTFYTNDGTHELVTDHKWIIQREIEGQTDDSTPLAAGTEITMLANHMPGMKGAKATIVSSQVSNVYIVDVAPFEGQASMKNHRWLIQSELKAN